MTAIGAGYKMESSESVALKSINQESYDYRDQSKLLTKLTGDVSYMAQYMRHMQQGIDSANENVIQQIGDLLNEILVVIGGGGDTGFDFGDLKYIFQAIGALFGFDSETGLAALLPINLLSAGWHFFSNYVLPINHFGEAISEMFDSFIATVLDIFGEVPIVGQALQQLAVWLSDIKDFVDNIGNGIAAFFDGFNINWDDPLGIGQLVQNITDFFGGIDFSSPTFNIFDAAWQFITNVINPLNWFNNAANFFGQIGSGLLGLIPGSHITEASPNLLTNSSFDTAGALATDAIWSWDSTQNHTPNVSTSGSARVVASGVAKDLSSDMIPVSKDQVLDISGWVKWTGLTKSPSNSDPIKLSLTIYKNTGTADNPVWTAIDTPDVVSDTSNLAGSGWRELTGTYTVLLGQDAVRLRCHIDPSATAGTIWFDDLSMKKTNKIPHGLIDGLESFIAGIGPTWDGIWDALGLHVLNEDFKALIRTITGGIGDTLDAITSWLQQLLFTDSVIQGAQIVGNIGDGVVSGIGNILDGIAFGLTGNHLFQPDYTKIQDLFTQQAATLTGANSRIQVLEQKLNSGFSVADTFNRNGPLGSDWALMPTVGSHAYPTNGSGDITCNGNDAIWSINGNGANTKLYRWVGVNRISGSDFQNIGIVLSSTTQDPATGATPLHHLLARVSDDCQNYIRLQIGYDTITDDNVQLFYCRSGVETRLYTGDFHPLPGTGSVINLYCGEKGGNPRKFSVYHNGQPIWFGPTNYLIESGSASMYGNGYRGWGFGMSSGSDWLNWFTLQQAVPGNVNTWAAQDQ